MCYTVFKILKKKTLSGYMTFKNSKLFHLTDNNRSNNKVTNNK